MNYFVFDLDDTLYNLMEPFEKTHLEIFSKHTNADCEELFRMSRVYSDQAFYAFNRGEITKEEEFHFRIKRTYADVGIEVTKEESKLFEQRYRYYQRQITLPEKIKEMLTFFTSQNIAIALLTNGGIESQAQKIAALGLSKWIPEKYQFISRKVGYSKPDVRIFRAVENTLQAKPKELYYIGDAFEMDIVGATNAGWNTVWFNHRQRKMPKMGIIPTHRAENLDDFVTLMKILADK